MESYDNINPSPAVNVKYHILERSVLRTHRWIDNSNVLYQNRWSCPVNICCGYCTQRRAALGTRKVKVNSQERSRWLQNILTKIYFFRS